MDQSTSYARKGSGRALTITKRAKRIDITNMIKQFLTIMTKQCIKWSPKEFARPGKMAHGKGRAWSRRQCFVRDSRPWFYGHVKRFQAFRLQKVCFSHLSLRHGSSRADSSSDRRMALIMDVSALVFCAQCRTEGHGTNSPHPQMNEEGER